MSPNYKKIILAGIFGNAIEGYDFTIYAFLAPFLAPVFFPNSDPALSILLTLSVFAVGFVFRPIGGIVFGYIGDLYGRRSALVIAIVVMTGSTFFIALLPDYKVIGVWAPILLTIFRLAQSFAISGELAAAMTYFFEHASEKRRGLIGSFTMLSGCFGTVVGSAVVAILINEVNKEQIISWGWRLPFLLGGIIGFVGLIMRLQLRETLAFEKAKQSFVSVNFSLFKHLITLNYRKILLGIALTSIMSMSYYFIVSYFNVLLISTLNHPQNVVILINFICISVLTCLIPIFGFISDKVGGKTVFSLGIFSLMLFVFPVFWLLQQQGYFYIFLGELIFVVSAAPIIAMIPSMLAQMFQVNTRNASIALAYNISHAIFGGIVPLVLIKLSGGYQNLYMGAWFVIVAIILSVNSLLKVREKYTKVLV